MAVLRIVPNVAAGRIAEAAAFYGDLLGLEVVMDHGWIVTFAGAATARVQISVAREGGSGAAVPDVSVEVDDVDAVHARAIEAGWRVEYALTDEPWGVRRFFLRDPFGKLVNILSHGA